MAGEERTAALFGGLDAITPAAQAVTLLANKISAALEAMLAGKIGVRVTLVDSGLQFNFVPPTKPDAAEWER